MFRGRLDEVVEDPFEVRCGRMPDGLGMALDPNGEVVYRGFNGFDDAVRRSRTDFKPLGDIANRLMVKAVDA